jgi:dTDP-4-amino-4,6-dideoxygalactose transaminase
MDPDRIEALITDRTVAIIPVHVYGNICDVRRIEAIAQKHGLKVIYDGAHAFGETYLGEGVGNFGDATMFSFHATKVFNTIEGGAVSFKDRRYCEPLHELKNFGIHNPEEVNAIGGNAKLDEFRAAMGICNLKRMDQCIAARKAVHDRYFERLGGVDGIVLCAPQEGVISNYAYFPVYFDRERFGKSRDDVFAALKDHEIYARKYFYPLVSSNKEFSDDLSGLTPIAKEYSENVLCLPMYAHLDCSDVNRICDIILSK